MSRMWNSWKGLMLRGEAILMITVIMVGAGRGAECDENINFIPRSSKDCNRPGLDSALWNVAAVPSYAVNWAHHQGTTADLETGIFGEALQRTGGPPGENVYSADWAEADVVIETSVIDEREVEVFESNACAPNRLCRHYIQVGHVFNSMTL
ncbi:hypothetical protein MPTK1_6g00400 [Marchantia polymorpha subsp. ruderalis]|uniref:SCP domain-containing protein n=2 Tax=Marchantia polymorpha TaxID=3197 RepID=A0AAF6BM14_MARPO|nr:hypothetical protein MARPO_0104s0026 [Marchantia polymorpha]BBN13048.1 hypothetical protein Mp_6g00400 [Marchantia polymorpha subsp. ruderalis]|eukprot:PTQ31997.1 hypothetical protein MARPO_0104s0026 [Marchantia polymorpha]